MAFVNFFLETSGFKFIFWNKSAWKTCKTKNKNNSKIKRKATWSRPLSLIVGKRP